jgi:hypothetical protein
MKTTRICIAAVVLGAMTSTAYSDPVRTPIPPDPMDPAADPNNPTRIPPVPEPDPQPTTYPAQTYPATYPPEEKEKTMFERLGLSIAAGGGVSGFTDGSIRDNTKDGGGWDVRATFGTRSFLSFEAEYIGTAQSISALGLDSDAMLVSNGVQGALRLNFLRKAPVQPFLFAGVAWRRYDVTNTSTAFSDVNDQDDVVEVPAGIGVAYRWKGLLLDARGEFRATTDNDLMPRFTVGGLREPLPMHRYGVNASIGYEF